MKTSPKKLNSARRKQLLTDMPSALQEVARQVEAKLNLIDSGTAMAIHAIGDLVDKVANYEEVYGWDAARQLAEYHDVSGGMPTLNSWRTIAMAYPDR